MWTNNPFVRKTHGAAYVHGSSVFSGIAADMGIVALKSHMAAIYNERQGRRFTTPQIEAELIRRSGSLQIARYFNKFVYGFQDLAGWQHPDLFLRDAGDDPGDVPYSGIFWLSPDVWVRRADDGGTVHQNPEHGQDNWFYARLHNRGNAASRSFVVGWRIKVWAGTEFVFPGDWFPLTAAKIGFDLAPGETRIVKARWPKEDIPPVGSHGCLLALVFDPDDPPATGAHVWEHNNLAQRNMTVVDLFPDEFALLDFWLGSRHWLRNRLLVLELVRPQKQPDLDVRLTHKSPELIKDLYFNQAPDRPDRPRAGRSRTWYDAPQEIQFFTGAVRLLPGAGSKWSYEEDQEPAHGSPRRQADLVEGPDGSLEIKYHDGVRVAFPVTLPGGRGLGLRLRFRAPAKARPGDSFRFDLIQRAGRKQVFGGFSVQINIKE
jgi:hypothetical protein